MELATGGELFDQIVERGTYTEQDAAQVAIQMCDAVRILHDKCDIVHADLKPGMYIYPVLGFAWMCYLLVVFNAGRVSYLFVFA